MNGASARQQGFQGSHLDIFILGMKKSLAHERMKGNIILR